MNDTERLEEIIVVIVDDHRMFAEMLAEAVDDEPGMRVAVTAHTAEDALSALGREFPTVVIVDLSLGRSDGIDLARQIKIMHPDVPVVILTGFGSDADVLRALEVGCSGFVSKEAELSEFVRAIRVVAGGGTVFSAEALAKIMPHLLERQTTTNTLTRRELEVLQLVSEGRSNREIGDALYVSYHTVRNHVQAILTKLGAGSRLEAVATAYAAGLIRPPGV